MHFSWLMHLFIFVLLNVFSSNKADLSLYDSEENELTTKSLESQELTEGLDEYDGKRKTVETTTPMIKTTKYHKHSHNDDAIYDEDHDDDETTSSTTLATTTSSSSSSSLSFSIIRLTTHVRTETTTHRSEIPATSSIDTFSIMVHNRNKQVLMSTTMDSKQIAALQAQTNRDRLFLKIFFIIVVVGMFSLAIVLITIHMVRKTRRYQGYRPPANTSSHEQSKRLNNIKV